MHFQTRNLSFPAMAVAAALALACGAVMAQPAVAPADYGTAAKPATASPAPASSAPKAHRKGSIKWWGEDVTPGWSLMTWKERYAHRKHMRSFKSYDECRSYLDQHHQQMAERAQQKGKGPLADAKQDGCAGLKP